MSEKSMRAPIGLAEMIYQVKRELLQPEHDLGDPVPLLAVEEIDLEIGVTVSKDGEGGIDIQVVKLGGGVGRSDVQTVHVKLAPLLTREERLAELKKDPRWSQVVQAQVAATLKGVDGESLRDQY